MAFEFATKMQYVQRVCCSALSRKGASPAEMSSSGFPMQKSFFKDMVARVSEPVVPCMNLFLLNLGGPKPVLILIIFFFKLKRVTGRGRKMSMNTTL